MRTLSALLCGAMFVVLADPAEAQRRHWDDPPQGGAPAAGAPATSPRDHKLHYTLLQQPPRALPKKIVILPPDVTVKEISAGGVIEKVPKWTDEATANVTRTVNAAFGARRDIEIVPLPALSAEDRDLLEEYLGVYFQVAVAAHRMTAMAIGGWEHKRERFDYTLGEGLRFLREKTGADAALMVIGEDYVSSSERKAAFVLAAIFGVGIPLGHSVLSAGVVDLNNGDLLWMHHNASVSQDLKDGAAVDEMLKAVFSAYPGLPAGGSVK